MFDLINGRPIHPLVVHAVVVLLPIACLGTIAIVLRPAWRGRYGVLVVACAAAATVLMPVATSSGEALEERVGSPGEHAELGDQLIWFTIPLLLLSLALVVLDRRQRAADQGTVDRSVGSRSRGADTVEESSVAGHSTAGRSTALATAAPAAHTPSVATRVVAALALVAALAATVQVYRVGDSGARAAWGDRVQSSK